MRKIFIIPAIRTGMARPRLPEMPSGSTRHRPIFHESRYYFKQVSGTEISGVNQAQGTLYTIDRQGYTVATAPMPGRQDWKNSFALQSIGKGARPFFPSARPENKMDKDHLLQDRGSFHIEYLNEAGGLRQNFIIERRPDGKDQLTVKMKLINTGLVATLRDGQSLQLADAKGKTLLGYDQLKVWDAGHNALSAHMELTGNTDLAIVVDDRHARYPLTIDPLNHTAEWTIAAPGIYSGVTGQVAIDAAFGYSVAGLGDVNGDGYDDVAIGAPGLVNLISGSGSLSSVGAVFVYYGGPNGLSTTPSVVLQPSGATAGALFGFSIAGGDINGDGKNDIIVGAPMDQVTLSIGGGKTASGSIGKVYVFQGGNLSGNITSPLATLQLNSSLLEHNVNLSINALFGYSVAVTEDLNKDGKKDIIVGSPTYAGIKNVFF